jgi:glycosyltransferase involved in cell wall biosynthesis
LAGLVDGVPEVAKDYGLNLRPWLLRQGLPEGSFIDLPFTHNLLMPSVLRDCDMAIFPNRCEGGTNLVAMEAMACGVPTYVSYNTGQKDLVDLIGCGALRQQGAVKQSVSMQTTQDWGESSVEETVAAMETVYHNRQDERRRATTVAEIVRAEWEWGGLNEKLIATVCEGQTV